jgi:hypothetical protein
LQFGHDQFDDILQPLWQDRRQNVEAVGRAILEPALEFIDHLAGRADQHEMAARRRDPSDQLADGQLLPLGQIPEQALAALPAFGEGRFGGRAVRVQPGQIPVEEGLEPCTPACTSMKALSASSLA